MKKFISVITMAIMLGATSVYAAGPNNYVGVKLGAFFPNSDSDGLENFKTGFNGEIDYGYKFIPNFALEAGVGWYSAVDKDNSDIKVTVVPVTLTAIGILPIDQIDLIGGVGLGYYSAKAEAPGFSEDKGAVGYHLLIGADYNLTNEVALGLEGKWFQSKPKFNDTDTDVGGIDLNLGVKYRF